MENIFTIFDQSKLEELYQQYCQQQKQQQQQNNTCQYSMEIRGGENQNNNRFDVQLPETMIEQHTIEKATLLSRSSQLSTFKTSSMAEKRQYFDTIIATTIQSLMNELERENIPTYLLPTNSSFDQSIQKATLNITSSINIEELRQIAILIYQFKKTDLEKSLWSSFLKSGTGILKTEQESVKIWPDLLKIIIQSFCNQLITNEDITDRVCFSITYAHLRRLEYRYRYYQGRLDDKTKSIVNYELIIEPVLHQFIQEHLRSVQMDYEYKIAMISYDYEDQRLAYEIQQQQQLPNDTEKQMIERLCYRKYEQEKSKLEVRLFQQHLKEKKRPKAFESIEIPCPSYIHTIENHTKRQQLIDQHKKIIEEYKNEMMILFINMSEIYMHETQKLFDQQMTELWQHQRSLPMDQQFTPRILNLIEQRLSIVTERNNMKIFPDHFEIVDDDDDRTMHNDMNYDQKLKDNFNIHFNFDLCLNQVDAEEEEEQEQMFYEHLTITNHTSQMKVLPDNEITMEEQISSQRLSHLSMMNSESELSTVGKQQSEIELTTSPSIEIKSCPHSSSDDNIEYDSIPSYLLASNKLFDEMIQNTMDMTCSIDIEDLRQMAYFLHQRDFYERLYHLWSIYLQAGLGQLNNNVVFDENSNDHHQQFWSKHVTTLIRTSNVDVPFDQMTDKNKQTTCELIVSEHLQEYQEKIDYYQKQLKENENYLNDLTLTMRKAIEMFVEQYGIIPNRMKCDYAIAILYNDYQDYQLKYKYQQEKPTDYQKQIAKFLYDTHWKLETIKQNLIIHRLRILYRKPPTSYDRLQIAFPSCFVSITNRQLRQQFIDRYKNLIERTKTDLIAVRFMAMEANIDQYQTSLNQQMNAMLDNHNRHVENKEMTKDLLHIIDQRSILIKKKLQIKSLFHIYYYLRSPLGLLEEIDQGHIKNIERIGFSSNLIIDSNIIYHCTKQQFELLNRGPTYVAPCQLHVSTSLLLQTIDTIVSKQYESIEHQLPNLCKQYSMDLQYATEIQKKIKDEFRILFSTLIPTCIHQRAFYEQQLIQSIQQSLKTNQLILRRTADHKNLFYLTDKTKFEEKCHQFMSKHNDDFELIDTLTDQNQADICSKLADNIYKMNRKLENFLKENYISKHVYEKLYVKSNEIKLGYLYFLPDISLANDFYLFVKPMFSMYHSLTWKLGNFIFRLLQPTMISIFKSTRVYNDSDFIEKLYRYCSIEHHLHSKTLFVRIKIKNFYTMYSYQSIIDRVGYVLTNHLSNHPIENISIVTIERLLDLYLKSNLFYFEGNIYRFMHGLPQNVRLSDLLLNLASYPWQNMIMNDYRLKTEFMVRYNDELLFTWNHSEKDLHTFLQSVQEKYDDIHMNIACGQCTHYLNVYIENRFGHLYTRVYYPLDTRSKLILPYVVGHPMVKHQQWFQSALIRAVQLCSNYQDFNQERIYMEMTYLTYGYSIDMIENELKKIFHYFDIETHRFHMNDTVYEKLRCRLLNFIDIQRKMLDHDLELEQNERIQHLYYLYDYGPYKQFEEKFHNIWSTYIKNDSQRTSTNTKILLNAKHIFSLNTLLTQQKPTCELLN
ncbi:unnamed protein product [Rotaria sordida]|uniref:Helix-turn-helix domain-containing protein n=1 Tax=Rotaria sordida TaxID=392033 RepID=A0A818V1A7_9BILA|nr:unnamed protein product [Rotaria sordida]CAF3705955.1 unnamed protein product [Rotaria sordida]